MTTRTTMAEIRATIEELRRMTENDELMRAIRADPEIQEGLRDLLMDHGIMADDRFLIPASDEKGR